MQFSPFSCHLISLRSKYPPQHPVFEHPPFYVNIEISYCPLALNTTRECSNEDSDHYGYCVLQSWPLKCLLWPRSRSDGSDESQGHINWIFDRHQSSLDKCNRELLGSCVTIRT
jgi:hypothetical protein